MLAGAWLATQWLLRESAISRDRYTAEVRGAQRDADDIWWSEDKPLSMLRTMLNPARFGFFRDELIKTMRMGLTE